MSERCEDSTSFKSEEDPQADWRQSLLVWVRCEKKSNHEGLHVWHSEDKRIAIAWPRPQSVVKFGFDKDI